MAVDLPASLCGNNQTIRFLDAANYNKGITTGATHRVDRPGTHWSIDLNYPPQSSKTGGLLSVIIKGKSEGLRVPVFQGNYTPNAALAPTIVGTNIQGTSLPVTGLPAGVVIQADHFFNVTRGDQTFLHMVVEEATADGSGNATLRIEPPLHIIASNAETLEFVNPVLQGYITTPEWVYQMALDRHYRFTLSVEESL